MKAILVAVCVFGAAALDNGLGFTPGMGWNSDYCVDCVQPPSTAEGFEYDSFVRHIADVMAADWARLGYHYVNMDSEWDLKTRDAEGNLQPDPTKWPNGMEAVVDYVHGKGLGFGVYGDRGNRDCNGNPGNLGHNQQDADFYAKYEVDWYKSDSCSATADHDTAFAEYKNMTVALNNTGRPIWFALCGWNPWYAPVGKSLGNSWRTGPDTICGWTCVMENIQNVLPIAEYSGKSAHGGGHNDLCLLLNPDWKAGTPDEMTPARHRSQFNLWCVVGANLLVTGNLSAIDPFAIETWTNAEAIAVNQDPAQLPYVVLETEEGHEPRLTVESYVPNRLGDPKATLQECGGEPLLQKWSLGDVFPFSVHNSGAAQCLNVADCGTDLIFDGCTNKGCSHGQYSNEAFNFTSDGTFVSLLNNMCVTATSDMDLELTPCQSPPPANQQFTYDTSSGEIKSGGHCLTASGSEPIVNSTLTIARPTSTGAVNVVFLSNLDQPSNVTCGAACFEGMGFSAGQHLTVRDLWLHDTIATVTAGSNFSVAVNASGASRFLSFTPA